MSRRSNPQIPFFHFAIFLITLLLSAYMVVLLCLSTPPPQPHPHKDASQELPFAVLISTNLVRQNCSCGFCNPSTGAIVPEHLNAIGFDLRYEVSTNFLPIVYR